MNNGYVFSKSAPAPQASQQRQPTLKEIQSLPPAQQYTGMTNLSDNYTYLGQEQRLTGFTNHFLESRDQRHFFEKNYQDYDLFERKDEGHKGKNNERDLLKGFQEAEPVSIAFFAERNVNFMKHLICDVIRKQSAGKYVLTPESQSTSELLIIMRSIYLTNAKQLPDNIGSQVEELNYAVLLDIVPRVLKNIQQQLTYIRDQSSQPLTMERPLCVSSAGLRSASNKSVTKTFI